MSGRERRRERIHSPVPLMIVAREMRVMESMSVTLQAVVLLVIALGAIIGTIIINPALTVMLAVALVVVNGLILMALTMRPSGS